MPRVCGDDYKAKGLLTFCLSKKPGSVIFSLKNTMLVAKTVFYRMLSGKGALTFHGGTQGAAMPESGTGGWRLNFMAGFLTLSKP